MMASVVYDTHKAMHVHVHVCYMSLHDTTCVMLIIANVVRAYSMIYLYMYMYMYCIYITRTRALVDPTLDQRMTWFFSDLSSGAENSSKNIHVFLTVYTNIDIMFATACHVISQVVTCP